MSCPPFVRVLVVEDFEPFRRFIHTTLQETELQVVGEAWDGLEAVRKAEELQPALTLLDIGLPSLRGRRPRLRIRHLTRLRSSGDGDGRDRENGRARDRGRAARRFRLRNNPTSAPRSAGGADHPKAAHAPR